MSFIEFHLMGGIEFMGVLFLTLLAIIVVTVIRFKSQTPISEQVYWQREGVRQIGLFALFFGLLGQIIGLMGAFKAIEMAGDVSQGILAGGLFVSSLTTAYGMVIFLLSLILDFIVRTVKS